MENKINITELLKDCPKGMELNCTMFDGVLFDEVIDDEDLDCPILIRTKEGETWNLTKEGCWDDSPSAKCVIFPKGKTTWEGFVPPCKFKDGDILAEDTCIFIVQKIGDNCTVVKTHCTLYDDGDFDDGTIFHFDIPSTKLATEEEKQKLFQAIKKHGYKWNAETKTLEKLVEPKFKVGDKVRHKNNHGVVFTITSIEEDFYACGVATAFWFDDQDDYELVPDKFDISILKPFESRVLVRDYDKEMWRVSFWGCLIDNKYDTTRGYYKQCIPYEGNEHLLGKTEECKDFYKTW